MDKVKTRRRGPRSSPEGGADLADESVVLQSQLYGRILAIVRTSLEISQQALAREMNLPASTVSKLEQGTIVVGVHHLDLLAATFTRLAQPLLGDAAAWRGSELHLLAEEIARALDAQGLVVVWGAEEDFEPAKLVPERKLSALVKSCWPAELRRRIGW